jgi:hypothetical protein
MDKFDKSISTQTRLEFDWNSIDSLCSTFFQITIIIYFILLKKYVTKKKYIFNLKEQFKYIS